IGGQQLPQVVGFNEQARQRHAVDSRQFTQHIQARLTLIALVLADRAEMQPYLALDVVNAQALAFAKFAQALSQVHTFVAAFPSWSKYSRIPSTRRRSYSRWGQRHALG